MQNPSELQFGQNTGFVFCSQGTKNANYRSFSSQICHHYRVCEALSPHLPSWNARLQLLLLSSVPSTRWCVSPGFPGAGDPCCCMLGGNSARHTAARKIWESFGGQLVQECGGTGPGATGSEGSSRLTASCRGCWHSALLPVGPQQLSAAAAQHQHRAVSQISSVAATHFHTRQVLTPGRIALFLHRVLAVIEMQKQI